MGKLKYLFLIFACTLAGGIFFSPQKATAADSDVVINEVMANAPTPEDKLEWLELYNNGDDDIDLKNWTIDAKVISSGSQVIKAKDYLIIARSATDFLNQWPEVTVPVVQVSIGLANRGDKVTLKNPSGTYIEEFQWITDSGDNLSWERIDPASSGDDNWQISYVLGGTPGATNSKLELPDYPPEVLELVDLSNALVRTVQVSRIIDGDTIEVSGLSGFPKTIRLLAVDAAESGQALFEPAKDFTGKLLGKTVDLIISQAVDEQLDSFGRTLAVIVFQDRVFNTQLMEHGLASFYNTDNLVLKNAAWENVELQAKDKKIGLWASASGESVRLSELLPDPIGTDSEGEWIEIYNPLETPLNVSYFLLDDYLIPYGTIIAPHGFLVFPRSQTGITLNNSGDSVKLYFPDGNLVDETFYSNSDEGMSWALINNTWYWTEKPTPNVANILLISEAGGDEPQEIEENVPINSSPINIQTGEYRNYENYLVTITGTVMETSGNTFYLDDGSGKAKVYIQAATGIDKPEMHKGDIFQVTGIVNLYRDTWRILPQKQDDINLIQQVQKDVEVKGSTAKKSTAKTTLTSKKSAASTTKARSPTSSGKQIAGTTNGNNDIQVAGAKSPWWVQITKAILGLAIILLGLLIFKIIQYRRTHPSVSSFGDET